MSDETERNLPRPQEIIFAQRGRLIRVLATGTRNDDALVEMQQHFPDYTQENLTYDRKQLRKAWKARVNSEHAIQQARELDRLEVMLEIVWGEFRMAKNDAIKEITQSTQKYGFPTVVIDGAILTTGNMVEVERIEAQKEVIDHHMVKFWWKQIMELQDREAHIKGLHHINVNVKKEQTVYIKGYVNFAPHEVWPNLPAPAVDDAVEGEYEER